MLLLNLFISTAIGGNYTQTKFRVFKRSPDPTVTTVLESQAVVSNNQELFDNSKEGLANDLEVKLEPELPPTKLQKTNPPSVPTVISYIMLRNLKTVPQAWQEYKYGLNGSPSIETMIANFGLSWLTSRADDSYYHKRRKLYSYIQKAIDGGQSEVDVVHQLEKIRIEQNWTLSTLQDNFSSLTIDKASGRLEFFYSDYELLRNLTTVHQVWEEYKYGKNGNPSVESLEIDSGTGWITSNTERRYYYSRKRIYDYILNAIRTGSPEEDAVNDLEKLRLENKWTLKMLQQNIGSLSEKKRGGKPPETESVNDG